MEPNTNNKDVLFCKRLKYGELENPTTILGIIISDKDGLLIFKTAKRTTTISNRAIISLEDTNIVFQKVPK